jgi:hypothetical protein
MLRALSRIAHHGHDTQGYTIGHGILHEIVGPDAQAKLMIHSQVIDTRQSVPRIFSSYSHMFGAGSW